MSDEMIECDINNKESMIRDLEETESAEAEIETDEIVDSWAFNDIANSF